MKSLTITALTTIAAAMVGAAIGALLAYWPAAPAPPQLPPGPTPQQRIDEAFDALGMQRRQLPPGLPP